MRYATLFLVLGFSTSLAGCQREQSHHLIGSWVGFPLAAPESEGYFSADEVEGTKTRLEFTNDGLFEMSLSRPDLPSDVIRGSWSWGEGDSATENHVVLKTDESRTIRLQIEFHPDFARFIARQVDGDSRIGDVIYERQ